MRTTYFREIYLDSEIGAIGGGQVNRVHFPSSTFSVTSEQMMKLVLTSFEMRRNWYSINKFCNTFYVYNPVGPVYTPVVIAPGSYRRFDGTDSLGVAIKDALDTALGGTNTVSWSEVTRKYSIVCQNIPVNGYFVCFQVKSTPPNPDEAVITREGYFNDVAEILGAIPTRDGYTTPINAFGATTGPSPVVHQTPYVAALNAIETLFLRTSLQTNNYQSPSFEQNVPISNSTLIPTNIFARIPLSRAHYDDTFEIIQYEDHNDNFTILLQQAQLSDMVFAITDHAGRNLAEVGAGQSDNGNLSFKMSFRWEVIEQDIPQGERRIPLPPLSNMKITM